jgi:hypothetical protein
VKVKNTLSRYLVSRLRYELGIDWNQYSALLLQLGNMTNNISVKLNMKEIWTRQKVLHFFLGIRPHFFTQRTLFHTTVHPEILLHMPQTGLHFNFILDSEGGALIWNKIFIAWSISILWGYSISLCVYILGAVCHSTQHLKCKAFIRSAIYTHFFDLGTCVLTTLYFNL